MARVAENLPGGSCSVRQFLTTRDSSKVSEVWVEAAQIQARDRLEFPVARPYSTHAPPMGGQGIRLGRCVGEGRVGDGQPWVQQWANGGSCTGMAWMNDWVITDDAFES